MRIGQPGCEQGRAGLVGILLAPFPGHGKTPRLPGLSPGLPWGLSYFSTTYIISKLRWVFHRTFRTLINGGYLVSAGHTKRQRDDQQRGSFSGRRCRVRCRTFPRSLLLVRLGSRARGAYDHTCDTLPLQRPLLRLYSGFSQAANGIETGLIPCAHMATPGHSLIYERIAFSPAAPPPTRVPAKGPRKAPSKTPSVAHVWALRRKLRLQIAPVAVARVPFDSENPDEILVERVAAEHMAVLAHLPLTCLGLARRDAHARLPAEHLAVLARRNEVLRCSARSKTRGSRHPQTAACTARGPPRRCSSCSSRCRTRWCPGAHATQEFLNSARPIVFAPVNTSW